MAKWCTVTVLDRGNLPVGVVLLLLDIGGWKVFDLLQFGEERFGYLLNVILPADLIPDAPGLEFCRSLSSCFSS